MKLTREKALELHKRMWTDMKQELGDNPTLIDRFNYKMEWCAKYFPNEHISGNCFLCEYTFHVLHSNCKKCPIIWPKNNCVEDCYYQLAPLSEILKLSKRKPAIIDKIITKWNGVKIKQMKIQAELIEELKEGLKEAERENDEWVKGKIGKD